MSVFIVSRLTRLLLTHSYSVKLLTHIPTKCAKSKDKKSNHSFQHPQANITMYGYLCIENFVAAMIEEKKIEYTVILLFSL